MYSMRRVEGQPWVPVGSTLGPRFFSGIRVSLQKLGYGRSRKLFGKTWRAHRSVLTQGVLSAALSGGGPQRHRMQILSLFLEMLQAFVKKYEQQLLDSAAFEPYDLLGDS